MPCLSSPCASAWPQAACHPGRPSNTRVAVQVWVNAHTPRANVRAAAVQAAACTCTGLACQCPTKLLSSPPPPFPKRPPASSASSRPSSMHATSASPLPRVEMVTVNGLNSHSATPAACTWGLPPPRRASSADSILQVGWVGASTQTGWGEAGVGRGARCRCACKQPMLARCILKFGSFSAHSLQVSCRAANGRLGGSSQTGVGRRRGKHMAAPRACTVQRRCGARSHATPVVLPETALPCSGTPLTRRQPGRPHRRAACPSA